MSDGIGWLFPPTGGGVKTGWNDPAITHFGGAREQGLARETIQNSLDARDGLLSEPVDVEFDLHDVDTDWFGKEALARTIEACVAEAEGDEKASTALRESASLLEQPSLKFLRIADSNTTGLRGKRWETLVKGLGTSYHESRGGPVTAGGSYGIGKSAPFAMTPLRTVFYWTRFEEGGEPRELFQGKAVLMSHRQDGEERQGTGFFGLTDGCEALEGDAVPPEIRSIEGARDSGTSLWIAGFPNENGWQERIARRVVASFFGAITDGVLSVSLEADRDITTIERDSLDEWFERLGGTGEDGETDEVEEARLFRDVLRTEEPAEAEIPGLGLCRLYIRVDDSDERLPSKVGLMRRTGMLITTQQRGLIRFPGLRRFIALCRFEAEAGNILLRQMENPQHNQFEPDHIEDAVQREQAVQALRRATDWIRRVIRERAAWPVSAEPAPLSELSRLLPDIQPEDPFGNESADGGDREPAFGQAPLVTLKPVRRPRRTRGRDNDGDGGDWEELTETDTDGPGDPPPPPDPPPEPPRGRRAAFPIRDARLTPVPGGEDRWRVSFTAEADGEASVALVEAGDSAFVRRGDIRAFDPGGRPLTLRAMTLEAGQRVVFEITAATGIAGRAWLVSAEQPEPAQ